MTGYQRQGREPESDSALGPMLGLRRPNYAVLDDELAPFYERQLPDQEGFVFISVGSILRHLFNEHSLAALTRGELNRNPRLLAAELVNIAAHYRHYAFSRHGLPTTVIMYHSTKRCSAKMAVDPNFRFSFYQKRLDGGANGEYDSLRRYVEYNLTQAKLLFERIPNFHLVDTGEVDPEAWPASLMIEGRIGGPALVVSSWTTDLQYVALGAGEMDVHERAVFHANGQHSRLIDRESVIAHALRGLKTGDELALRLAPEHIRYIIALAGDEDMGVTGIQKMGVGRAGKLVADRVAKGHLPPDATGLTQLCEDGGLSEEQAAVVRRSWGALIHADYARSIPQDALAALDAKLTNRSGLGELEQANATYFGGTINIEMAFSGENGF